MNGERRSKRLRGEPAETRVLPPDRRSPTPKREAAGKDRSSSNSENNNTKSQNQDQHSDNAEKEDSMTSGHANERKHSSPDGGQSRRGHAQRSVSPIQSAMPPQQLERLVHPPLSSDSSDSDEESSDVSQSDKPAIGAFGGDNNSQGAQSSAPQHPPSQAPPPPSSSGGTSDENDGESTEGDSQDGDIVLVNNHQRNYNRDLPIRPKRQVSSPPSDRRTGSSSNAGPSGFREHKDNDSDGANQRDGGSRGGSQPPRQSPPPRPDTPSPPPTPQPEGHQEALPQDQAPEVPNWRQQIVQLSVLAVIMMFVAMVLDCNVIMAHKPHRCPDKGSCPGDNNTPRIVLNSESTSEPLPVFQDLTALYRSWATFSTWSPFDSTVMSSHHEDDIDFEPIFNKLLEMGDVYDLSNDRFHNSSQGAGRRRLPEAQCCSQATHTTVDLVQLEHQVVGSMRNLANIFRDSSSAPTDWLSHVERRLSNLERKTLFEMEQDTRILPTNEEISWTDKSKVMPAHLEQVEHIQYLKDTPQRHYGSGNLEQVAAGINGENQLNETMQKLVQAQNNMNLLSRVMAHSSAEFLYDSTRDSSSVWDLFALFAAPYGDDDPLRKAVSQAEVLKDISEEQCLIHRMSEQIASLVNSLTRIIDCERAIDRHLDVLERTYTDHSTAVLSDGYLSYRWDATNKGWVTLRKKETSDEVRTFKDLGQRECKPLFDFQRHPSEDLYVDLSSDSQSANETVLQFVPAAKYLHAKYDDDMAFVSNIKAWL